TPASSLKPLSSLIARRASSASNGGTRNVTSPNTSVKIPPVPTVTTGPNNSSCETPMSISTPPLTISHTSTPSTRALLSARFALASRSSYAARTSLGDDTPTRTRPASLLCSRSGDEIFITTGKPTALAAFTAAADEEHSSSLLVLIPYAFNSCFEFHSESASPG